MPNETTYLKGRHLIFPLGLATSLFFLWGFSYGLLDVLNKHFQNVLKISKFESTTLQIAYFGGGYFCFSPLAAEILKRKGFRVTIVLGLLLFALGAVSFWPAIRFSNPENGRQALIGFILCTLIIACGLATLETSANSYVTIIGDPKSASMRLQFCQSWNGVGSFLGPLIASKMFFSEGNSTNLNNVQYVYIVVSFVAVIVAILFLFSKIPENKNENENENSSSYQWWKDFRLIFAFITIFAYVGTQVTNDSFFINYATENANFTDSKASNLLSYALITFTIGRFVGTVLLHFFEAQFILLVYSLISLSLTIFICWHQGHVAVIVFMSIYFFESVMFPIIFVIGLSKVDPRGNRRAAGILIMAISGGAVFPPIQGALADQFGIRRSFVVSIVGFVIVVAFAIFSSISSRFRILRQRKQKEIVEPEEKPTEAEELMIHSSS